MGFYDHYSRLDKVYLLHRKSDAAECIQKFLAWCTAHGVNVKRLHTDNAPEFHVPAVQRLCNHPSNKIRLTSCAPHEPRGNGAMERRWRIRGNDVRAVLHHAGSLADPAKSGSFVHLWWYVLRATVIVSNCTPSGGLSKAPWELFTGRKPSGREHRVLLCLAFYKDVAPASKVHARAHRALHLGRAENQPGYVLFDLQSRKVVVTPHVRFCETIHPGLSKAPVGGEPDADSVFPPPGRSVEK